MTYLRSFFFNFFIAFLVNRMVPGIQVNLYEEVPNMGADLLFSLVVGFLNASIFPFLIISEIKPSKVKIALLAALVSLSSFLLIAFIPFGVAVTKLSGGVIGTLLVWGGSFLTNYLEWRAFPK